jgi:putative flippase GtrA
MGSRKDYLLATVSGLLIGLLLIPTLATVKPSLYEALKFVIIPVFAVIVPVGLVVASWIGRRFPIIWQLAKFIVIGVLNTLVDIGALAFMLGIAAASSSQIGADDVLITLFIPLTFYTLYKSISFIIANINSYFWNKYWTFEANEEKNPSAEFVQFFVVSFIGFIINVAAASLIFSFFHQLGNLTPEQWGLIGAAFGSISGLAWNFIGYKFIVFKK